MKHALIVIPTYNEKNNITQTLERTFAVINKITGWRIDVLVVDDSSPDGTADIVKVIQKKYKNLHLLIGEKEGLGKAYVRGFQYGIENIHPTVFIEMDADGQHEPESLPAFFKKIEEGSDFVIGSRYIKGGSIPKEWGLIRKFFSIPGNFIIRLAYMKLKITDWTGGYRAIKAWIITDAISYITNYTGYVFQIALLDFALKHNANIKEIPIQFKERREDTSKMNSNQYLKNILSYILLNSPFIKFVVVGGIGFVLDFGISFVFIEKLGVAVPISTAISTEVAIISNFLLNNFWSFSYKKLDMQASVFFKKFLHFNVISLGSILIQVVGLSILTNYFGKQLWFVYKALIILFLIIPYSYIMYNRFIWKESKN